MANICHVLQFLPVFAIFCHILPNFAMAKWPLAVCLNLSYFAIFCHVICYILPYFAIFCHGICHTLPVLAIFCHDVRTGTVNHANGSPLRILHSLWQIWQIIAKRMAQYGKMQWQNMANYGKLRQTR